MSANSAKGIQWDLHDLFASHDDSRIGATLKKARQRAESFAERFRGIMAQPETLKGAALLDGLRELEAIYEALGRVGTYAGLLYASDSANPEYQDLEQKVEQQTTKVRNLLLFFELDWLKLEDDIVANLIEAPDLRPYKHYLTSLRRYRPHTLSEPEEKVINEKDNTGRNAFGRLFSEITSTLTFTLEKDGKTQDLNLSQMLSLIRDPNPDLRKRAMDTVYENLAQHGHILTFIYDTLLQDHLTMDRIRAYRHPMLQRNLVNEIDTDVVETMMAVTEKNYALAHGYFTQKAKLLGLPRLALHDQYAPVGKEVTTFTYQQAQNVILDAFGAFEPAFRQIASEFFAKNWIDAEIRPGKHGGAFCASPSPELHPYILCNYDDNLRDVMTVAHELGHGLHGCLSRKQSYFNYDTPLTTAETASVFGEMLVFDYLLEDQTDALIRVGLLAGKIEDIFATVFRQNVMTRFEESAFSARKNKRLTAEALGSLWLGANSEYYGGAVEVPDGYRWGWSYIPHFIHSRFYCYSYVFGQLLVLALYRMYKDEGKSFVPRYLALLEAGGSDTPEALLEPLGVDIHDAGFWQHGFDELKALVEKFQEAIQLI